MPSGTSTRRAEAGRGPLAMRGAFGYQDDGDTGLKLLGHRYYDASIGRFISRDFVEAGRNRYAYCDNNPLRRVDENGLDWHDPAQIVVSPEFKGQVIAFGDYSWSGSSSDPWTMITLGPGEYTHESMDVDMILVQKADGSKQWYWIDGAGLDIGDEDAPSVVSQ